MDLIFEILKKLRNYEIRNVRNLLSASPFEYEKVGRLFELVTRYKDKEEAFYSQKLYGKDPDNTFRVTKSRLKKLLEDAVIHEKSLGGYGAEYINASLQAKKRLIQGEILLGRGAYQASKNLLLQVSALARKYSLHRELFQAELLLSRTQSINQSVREFEKQTQYLLELNRTDALVNEAAILHYSLNNFLTLQTTEDEKTLKELRGKLERIGEIRKETGSPLAGYYHLNSSVLFHQYTHELKEARRSCEQFLELVQKEPALRSRQRTANASFQLAEISLRIGDMKEARKFIDDTLACFSKEETNYLIALSTSFRIAFYMGDLALAENITEQALAHPRIEASKFRAGSWYYFRACLKFRQKQYKEATRALQEATPLLGDKTGWNIAWRMLEIMIQFELGNLDLLDSRILNLKQFVRRTQKGSELFRPMQLIGILMEWQKSGLDLKKAWPAMKKKLGNLENYHREFPFDPNATELIRLEEWLNEKSLSR